MIIDESVQQRPDATVSSDRKAWSKPTLARLRSGSAENTPGATINDGPLETIGS